MTTIGTKNESENISMGERLALLLVLTVTVLGGYIYFNNNPIFAPHFLPLTAVDTATPFLVWTVWPYAFLNVSNAIMPFFIKRRDAFIRMSKTLAIAMGIHIAFWSLFPTTYPRPIPPTSNTLTDHLYLYLMSVDTPLNCFPSAHVAAPAVQLFFVGRAYPRLAPWLWSIFGLFSLSILTTKQHYIWDLGGAVIIVLFALKITEKRNENDQNGSSH